MKHISLGDIDVEVVQKDIKNVHLSVYPPTGRVRIAAPLRMPLETIRIYAIGKMAWIRRQQKKFAEQAREAPREYLNKEGHYFLGNRYLMKIVEKDAPPEVKLTHKTLELVVRPNTSTEKKQEILEAWYRDRLREAAIPLIKKWEKKMDLTLNYFSIRRMKTKWGSCNIDAKRMVLNTELAKKPLHSIEFIIIHELVHLKERNHNARFMALMDRYLPEWRDVKQELSKMPVGYVDWGE